MPRRVYAIDLIDDAVLIAAYRARHAPGAVWPAIVRDIVASGVEAMEIWQVDYRLVMIADVADDFPRPRNPATATVVAAWEAEMDRYQRPLHPGAEKWTPMARIFALSEQDAGEG